ncbi:MAG: ribosomal L7Ae/L30e/S12e/Gadd45 family protein [Clostridia bacterium]|nr:ribosomal L7Ae/L30e/S12e/Gadd45 family protein [Clostridia bacterium]
MQKTYGKASFEAMKCVGLKQVLKAIEANEVTRVYIGKDAEQHVLDRIISACEGKEIEIVEVDTMKKLGEMSGIEIGAATAAE